MTFAFRQNQPGSQGIKNCLIQIYYRRLFWQKHIQEQLLIENGPLAMWRGRDLIWPMQKNQAAGRSSYVIPSRRLLSARARAKRKQYNGNYPFINPYKVGMSRVCLDAKLLGSLNVRLEPCGTVPGARKPHPKIGAAHFTNTSLMIYATFAYLCITWTNCIQQLHTVQLLC